jgi:hypothetical protein
MKNTDTARCLSCYYCEVRVIDERKCILCTEHFHLPGEPFKCNCFVPEGSGVFARVFDKIKERLGFYDR